MLNENYCSAGACGHCEKGVTVCGRQAATQFTGIAFSKQQNVKRGTNSNQMLTNLLHSINNELEADRQIVAAYNYYTNN